MEPDIRVQRIGLRQRDLLIEMYDRFDPLGAALGLPPPAEEARRKWIEASLGHIVNVGAILPAGEAVGHCFLAIDKPGSAEMAIFVHQGFRRRGIGKALVQSALGWGEAVGIRRVWTLTSPDNRAALRLQESCGFRLTGFDFPACQMEIELCGGVLYSQQAEAIQAVDR